MVVVFLGYKLTLDSTLTQPSYCQVRGSIPTSCMRECPSFWLRSRRFHSSGCISRLLCYGIGTTSKYGFCDDRNEVIHQLSRCLPVPVFTIIRRILQMFHCLWSSARLPSSTLLPSLPLRAPSMSLTLRSVCPSFTHAQMSLSTTPGRVGRTYFTRS